MLLETSGSRARRAGDWLCLAAAPTFAAMALFTALSGEGAMPMCTSAPAMPPLNGMALMYALMAAFHAAPWLRLLAATRNGQS